jgi:HK97 family phage major capsid protein
MPAPFNRPWASHLIRTERSHRDTPDPHGAFFQIWRIAMTIAAVRAKRAAALEALDTKRKTAFDLFKTLATKKDFKKATDQAELDKLKAAVDACDIEIKATIEEYDSEIKRLEDLENMERATVRLVPGQEHQLTVAAEVNNDPYTSDEAAKSQGLFTKKGLMVGGFAKALCMGGGSPYNAVAAAKQAYGESHPITLAFVKALAAGIGPSGGFIVPPEYVNEIIELLRPRAVVRAANPRSMPMPRGTMTLPAQTSAASATYGSESGRIPISQPGLGQIVATYKKLTALVPVTNDLMRYASPAADAFVRDDLVKVISLREDLAFLTGDGMQDSPRGFLSFANAWAGANGGTVGNWSTTGNSTAAVDGATGGGFITSTETATLTTVANELAGMVQKLDGANVGDARRRWFFNPRIYNFLNNLLNSLGLYVYRDELSRGVLLGYPFSKSTQIPVNIHDASSAQTNCSFIFLVEMDDAILLDSMTMELSISREGTYYDTNAVLQSAFQQDQTLIRAISEHDFQMRHIASIAVDQFVTWSPAIS